MKQIANKQERQLRTARLAAQHRIWAYQDAKRGYSRSQRQKRCSYRDELIVLALLTAFVVTIVLAA